MSNPFDLVRPEPRRWVSDPTDKLTLVPERRSTRIVALDLGQSTDFCAAAVIDRDDTAPEPLDLHGPPNPLKGLLRCTALRRWPLHTDYCQVVSDVLDLPADVIVPDACGVGRPIVDLLRREAMKRNCRVKIHPVMTVGSNTKVASTRMEARGLMSSVPKIELVTSLMIAQQQGNLRLPNVPETQQLLHELAGYQLRYSQKGNVQFGNDPKKAPNDDLVVACALGVWYAMRFGVRRLGIYLG